jgi:hypothetical protein
MTPRKEAIPMMIRNKRHFRLSYMWNGRRAGRSPCVAKDVGLMQPSAWRASAHGRTSSSWQDSSRLSDQVARSDPGASRRNCSAGDRAPDIPKLADSGEPSGRQSSNSRVIHTNVGGGASQWIRPKPAPDSSASGSRCGQSPQVKSIICHPFRAKRDRRDGHRPFCPALPVRETPSYRGSRMVRRDRGHHRHRSAAPSRAVSKRGSRHPHERRRPRQPAGELDRSYGPADVRLDVVWHGGTRTDDHVAII